MTKKTIPYDLDLEKATDILEALRALPYKRSKELIRDIREIKDALHLRHIPPKPGDLVREDDDQEHYCAQVVYVGKDQMLIRWGEETNSDSELELVSIRDYRVEPNGIIIGG